MSVKEIFRKKRTERLNDIEAVPAAQSELCTHPFSQLDSYVPLCNPEYRVYEAIREAVPVVDAAIDKIIALVGGFKVVCPEKNAEKELNYFLKTVPSGGCSVGIDSFVSQHLEQLLMCGTSVSEIVLNRQRTGIAAVCNAPLDGLQIMKNGAVGADICSFKNGEYRPVRYPGLVSITALNPKPGEVCGTSLLQGLPFVTGILLKIYNTIGVNFERVGNLRYAVTYKPPGDVMDKTAAKDRAEQIAGQWSKAMRGGKSGRVSDFVAVGDVQIKVIGADNQQLDCEIPVRQMLEQIVAKTGLPPFLLGLSWSTTERMSSQQADILTSELCNYRRLLNPMLEKICRLWLNLNGYSCKAKIEWDNISLQDEVELARAGLYKMQAQKLADGVDEHGKNDAIVPETA